MRIEMNLLLGVLAWAVWRGGRTMQAKSDAGKDKIPIVQYIYVSSSPNPGNPQPPAGNTE